MARREHLLAVSVAAAITLLAGPARAIPAVTYADFLVQRYGPSTLTSVPEGDYYVLVGVVGGNSSSDPPAGLSVVAAQGAARVPLDFHAYSAPVFAPDARYVARIPLASADASSRWSLTATDSIGTSKPVTVYPVVHPQLLPFATAYTVSDGGTTPTVSWTLPRLTGFTVGLIRFRIIDAATEVWQLNTVLAPTATSFAVPAGILQPGRSYVYSVTLENGLSGLYAIENEASSFSDPHRVPEPGALALGLAALAALAGAGESARRPSARRASASPLR